MAHMKEFWLTLARPSNQGSGRNHHRRRDRISVPEPSTESLLGGIRLLDLQSKRPAGCDAPPRDDPTLQFGSLGGLLRCALIENSVGLRQVFGRLVLRRRLVVG